MKRIYAGMPMGEALKIIKRRSDLSLILSTLAPICSLVVAGITWLS